MSLRSDLIDKVEHYLTGKSSDRELEGWVVANLQWILNSGDTVAIHLADEVDASFVEVGEGIIDRAELRSRLNDLVSEVKTPINISSLLSSSFPLSALQRFLH
jgi:hypothetical protein